MKRHPVVVYAFIALLILGPLLLPGYILTLDMAWTPHTLGGMWTQKLMLLAIFTLAGLGAHRLMQELRPADPAGESAPVWPAYLAGLIYIDNPFVYTRFMAGQYLVLAGYALLPWLVRAVWRLLARPGWRRTIAVVAWASAIGCVSLHSLAPAAVVSLALVVAHAWGRWRQVGHTLGYLVAGAAAWLVINAFWLIPLLRGHGSQAQIIAGVTSEQLGAYATAGGPLGPAGTPLNVLVLQGFWADAYGRYLLPSAGPLFWLCALVILVLVVAGLVASLRPGPVGNPHSQPDAIGPHSNPRRLALALAAAGFIGWVLAIGWGWQYVPMFRGYREPHKWAMLLALSYAVLAPLGALALGRRRAGLRRRAVIIVTLLVPVLWVPMLWWGGAGQLRAAQYPAGWAELNQRLNALPAGRIVLFPWHQYIALDFAHRTVANPAPRYFDRPLISSDDPELVGVTQTSTLAANRAVQGILNQHFYMTDAGPQFDAADIRYIVVLKQADWRGYGWLDAQDGITLRADTLDYRLYEVSHPLTSSSSTWR